MILKDFHIQKLIMLKKETKNIKRVASLIPQIRSISMKYFHCVYVGYNEGIFI